MDGARQGGAAGPRVEKQREPLQGGDGIEGPGAPYHGAKARSEGLAWQPEGATSQAVVRVMSRAADQGDQDLSAVEGGEYLADAEALATFIRDVGEAPVHANCAVRSDERECWGGLGAARGGVHV